MKRTLRVGATMLAAGSSALLSAQTPPPPSPPACEAPEHRQFDFWVGRWDVYLTGKDILVAHSLIERLYAGCAIRENWMPLKGGGGGSLNSWRPAEQKWRQTWTDSSNNYSDYAGGMDGEAMVLIAEDRDKDGKTTLARMRFTREAGGAVRQLGTTSSDAGKSWQPSYDFTYRPAADRPS